MDSFFEIKNLSVGYDGRVLIHDIGLSLARGSILTLIGPNGAGKSTVLKTVARQTEALGGRVLIGGADLFSLSPKETARRMSVLLTDRVRTELTTCAEIVAMGRYPYTDMFGRLTPADEDAVRASLETVDALGLADRDFSTLSDGQRQRILLARAMCQEPDVMILDEPTAYLDIRHKIGLVDLLRRTARERGITVVMSMHETDLALKASDYIMCLKGERVYALGPPEKISAGGAIERLYDLQNGSYDVLSGSVELPRAEGSPDAFVIPGCGYGAVCLRALQKKGVPCACGVVFENDVDFRVAEALCVRVISSPAFEPVSEKTFDRAARALLECRRAVDSGAPVGPFNEANARLLTLARENGIPVEGPDDL